MLVIILKYNPSKISYTLVSQLAVSLPQIVAVALDIPARSDARLTSSDIEVWTAEFKSSDVNIKDLGVLIFAHQYMEYLINLDNRKNVIIGSVRSLLAKNQVSIVGWVWIHLSPTAFGRI